MAKKPKFKIGDKVHVIDPDAPTENDPITQALGQCIEEFRKAIERGLWK